MYLGKQKSGARLKKKTKKKHVPCGNKSALYLRYVKANIVTACCCFFFLLCSLLHGVGKWEKKCPRRVADTSVCAICWPLK